jgi:putative NADH-flavin reductase
MIITVFGATGQVGKRTVRYALAKGHTVRAFGRNIEGLIDRDLDDEKLVAIKGSVFDEDEVYDAVRGVEAVISSLGGAFDGNDKTRSLGIKTIAQQMQKAGVRRIVAVGGSGVLNAPDATYQLEGNILRHTNILKTLTLTGPFFALLQ